MDLQHLRSKEPIGLDPGRGEWFYGDYRTKLEHLGNQHHKEHGQAQGGWDFDINIFYLRETEIISKIQAGIQAPRILQLQRARKYKI